MIEVLVALLVAYGNTKSLVGPSAFPDSPWTGLAFGVVLILAVAVTTRAGPRLSASELGLVRRGSLRAAATGFLQRSDPARPGLLACFVG